MPTARRAPKPSATSVETVERIGGHVGPLWQEAAAFAARQHRHQIRKDGRTPYFAHPARVALTVVLEFGCVDPVAVTTALLHDTIEDTTADFEDVLEAFGADVAECVAALTKIMALPEDQREAEYDQRLAKADWRARLVKLADVFDNFSDVGTQPAEKQAEKRGKTLEHCRRALKLAERDGTAHPETRTALEKVRGLIAPYERS